MRNQIPAILAARPCRAALSMTLLCLTFLSVSTTVGQQPADPLAEKPLRELFVPYDELDVLLGPDTNRVYMSRDEYEQLRRDAHVKPGDSLPLTHALLEADYNVQVEAGRAAIKGVLQIEVLDKGLHALPLQFSGVGILAAQLDDRPAALAKNDQGETLVFIEGVGRHQLKLEMVMPVTIDAAQQTLKFHLPKAVTGNLELSVPGNIEIKSGAEVIRRQVDAASETTQFELVPSNQPVAIVLSLNNKKLRDQSTVIARGVLVAEVTQGYERLHATMSMGVLNGAIDEFRFAIADDLEVNSVSSDLLSRWSVETIDGQKQLIAKLRGPTSERVVINARLDRLKPQLIDWQMPRFQPLNVAGYSAVIGMLIEDRLSASAIEAESLIAIDSDVLTAALPSSLLVAEPGAPQLKAIAAFYAAQPQYAITSQFRAQPRRLIASCNSLVTLADPGLSVAGGFALMPQNEKLFFFDFTCPTDWNIDWIRTHDQRDLKFNLFSEAAPGGAAPATVRIRVLLPEGVAIGGQLNVQFQAQHSPANWQSNWEVQSIELPHFTLLDADSQFGAVAVQLGDDLLATPESISGLLIMNGEEKASFHFADVATALAYRYENAEWQATIKVERLLPRMTAQIMSFVQLQSESLVSHSEIIVNVAQARTRQIVFSLPESTPTEVTIRGLGEVVVKETASSVSDGRRIWTVQLAERQNGTLRLAVDFSERLNTSQSLEIRIPVVRTVDSEYQSGVVAVEGNAELEIAITQHPRIVDIGELVDAQYQVGKRLLGVYGYVGIDDTVTASITRIPVQRLPTTIVQRAEMVSLLSTQGVIQTAARFRLRSKSSYLEARLPADAHLWSVILDGKPALPQREQDRVLIALPANRQSPLRELQLVYETPSTHLLLRGQLNLVAPELRERNPEDEDALVIPIADLKWELILPSGYRITAVNGNLTASDSGIGQFPMQWFLKALWDLGGGRKQTLLALPMARRAQSNVEAANDFAYRLKAGNPFSGPVTSDYANSMLETELKTLNDKPMDAQATQAAIGDSVAQMPLSKGTPIEDRFAMPGAGPTPATPNFAPPLAQLPVPPTSGEPVAAPEGKASVANSSKRWALEGLRSLAINLADQTAGEHFALTSLGVDPRATVTITHQSRLNWLAIALGAMVFVCGALIKSRRRLAGFMFAVVLIACLAPPLTGWEQELAPLSTGLLAAVIALVTWSLLCGLRASLAERLVVRTQTQVKTHGISTVIALLLCIGFSERTHAQAPDPAAGKIPGEIVTSPEQLADLLNALGKSGKVTLPGDAVVIPFDPSQSSDAMRSEKLLLPYATYVELWNRAHPDKKITSAKLPASFAWSDATYSAILDAGESLQMTGTLTLEQYSDQEIAIPMNLAGCVLESATLDGQPPRLSIVQMEPQPASQQALQQTQPSLQNTMLMLYSTGKGRKKVELTLRWKIDKNSGWRAIAGAIPASPACKLMVTAPQPRTEVRFTGGMDRSVHETIQANEKIETVVATDGRLSIQWRDKISEAIVDQALTVQARSVFDIQEDSLKFAWNGTFDFRRGRRESFTLLVPSDYLIEKVVGNNIRGWTTKTNGSKQQLDVELLKAVAERETFSVLMSRQSVVSQQTTTDVEVPQIVVPGAMLQQGHVAIRRSLLLELRTSSASGVSRIDALDESGWLADYEEAGPLALRVFQAYRYSQVPFDVKLAVNAVQIKTNVQHQTLLRISQRQRSLETRLLIESADRPLYELQISFPAEWKLQPPELPGSFQWSLNPAGERQLLQINLANGRAGTFPIVVRGSVEGEVNANTPIALPQISVTDAQRQTGAIVVQADPAYDIRTESLLECETALLDSVNSWLAAKQREATRAVIRFTSANYSGALRILQRTPSITSFTVSNIKVTDRAIEETVFIEATIRAAGIREFTFQLPASMTNARIHAPLLQQKKITPVTDQPDRVRVQLLLQDEIMGQFRVVVENDRVLTSEQQLAPIPIVETGATDRRLITLENASRDELVSTKMVSMERLERVQLMQSFQADLLGGESSEAYLVQEGAAEPSLTYETKAREVLATVDARIGLAQTLIVVDELGTYRATQEFRVENRTEPFLEIELPAGARLWTVLVDGEPVKPAQVVNTSGAANLRVRVPLVKTAEGDLDYPIVLKYGGQLSRPSWMTRVVFPLIHTINIRVELSQVRLRLPESFDWFNFDGTLGRVETEGDLQAGWLSFRTRQLSELTQLLNSSEAMNPYSKARASNNLKQLEGSLQSSNYFFRNQAGEKSQELAKQLDANSAALQSAQQQVAQIDQQQAQVLRGNRAILNDLYESQDNGRSFNALDGIGQNFDVEFTKPNAAENGASQFQSDWFEQNKLRVEQAEGAKDRLQSDVEEISKAQKKMAAPEAPAAGYGDPKGDRAKQETKRDSDAEAAGQSAAGSQVNRYEQQLQQRSAGRRSVQQAPGLSNAAGVAGSGGANPAEPFGNLGISSGGALPAEGMGMPGGGMGGMMGGYPELPAIAPNNLGSISSTMAPNGPAVAGIQSAEPPAQGAERSNDGFMASLDVELPVRGREFLFSTPRGDVELSAQGVSHRDYQRLITIGTVLLMAVLLWGAYRLSTRLANNVWGSRSIVTVLTFFGILSLLIGYLPVFGALALLAAVGLALTPGPQRKPELA